MDKAILDIPMGGSQKLKLDFRAYRGKPEAPKYIKPEPVKKVMLSKDEQAFQKSAQNRLKNWSGYIEPIREQRIGAFQDQLKRNYEPVEAQSRENIVSRLGGLGNRVYVDALKEFDQNKTNAMSDFMLSEQDREMQEQNNLINQLQTLANRDTQGYNLGLSLSSPQNSYNLSQYQALLAQPGSGLGAATIGAGGAIGAAATPAIIAAL